MKARNITALLLALALCFGVLPAACGETEYPPRPAGAVADLAAVLGEKTVEDMETLRERSMDGAGFGLYVLTRHFLGGVAVQQYADKVFEVWGLGDTDALLLMVIGEESYALSLGAVAQKALPAETKTTLLGSFRTSYLNRQYDASLADLSVGLTQALAKAYGGTLDASGLLGRDAIQSTPQPQTVSDFWYGMFARDDYDALEDNDAANWRSWQNERQYEENHINWRSLIIWGLVIYFLFFRRSRRKRRARR